MSGNAPEESVSEIFDGLKCYIGFGAPDEQALREFYVVAQRHLEGISDEFYRHIETQPAAVAVFRSKAQVLRLKATLVVWMERLLLGPWDDEYFELRTRIGRVHIKVSLPQHYMMTAMSVMQEQMMYIVMREVEPTQRTQTIAAIQKVTNLDLALMMDSYREDYVRKIQQVGRKDRLRLRLQLQATQELYQSIFESSSIAIVVVDSAHCIRLVNSAVEERTGREQDTVCGFEIAKLFHVDDVEKMDTMFRTLEKRKRCPPCDLRFVPDGPSERWVRWHLTCIGETGDICMIGLDVTRERNLGETAARVKSLAALGTLAAGLAHEIRNPLNAAQLQLMLVDRAIVRAGDAVDKRAMQSSVLIKAELKRLGALVEEFLAFARPIALQISNVRVDTLCNEVVEFLNNGGHIMSVQRGSSVVARLDPHKLRQVLINLLRNAVEASGPFGTVILSCERVDEMVVLDVSDDGPGVPEDLDIFAPFATNKEGGTGLGLSIVHRIVTDHGGEIIVFRENNRTHFSVELPVDGPPV